MKKILIFFFFLFFPFFFAPSVLAQDNFVSVVNPVRGPEFWEDNTQQTETSVKGQSAVLSEFNIPATWLLRFDALTQEKVIGQVKARIADEKGLFLEVTPSWAEDAGVSYRKSDSWHDAGSALLTGYEQNERKKLIDAAFEKFKSVFGYFPFSVGAWWIDSFSLGYMKEKYGVSAALIVADQYSTDNYQIWGQYFSTPYYPTKNNALHPAQTMEGKLDIVITQWAARDPVNSYGSGVFESTYSVQANDYLDFHELDTGYFSRLLDIYTKQKFNKFGQVVVGLENSYSWEKYGKEYRRQMEVISAKKSMNEIKIVSMKEFALWYKREFPKLSPEHLILADDPLGSSKKTVWFMNPYYRAGWFFDSNGSVFRDIRQYIDGKEELCFKERCASVNFATNAVRVLDDVSFGHKWVIDDGSIKDLKIDKAGEEFTISYINDAGTAREIGFLPRDIRVDGKISSIDTAILNAVKEDELKIKNQTISAGGLKWSFPSVIFKTLLFCAFIVLGIIPLGFVIINKIAEDKPFLLKLFLSSAAGMVFFTTSFYLMSLLGLKQFIYLYPLINIIIFIRFKLYKAFQKLPVTGEKINWLIIILILAGTAFQAIPVFRSGLSFEYGLAFWGPNTHDGIWHLGLINQLLKSVPPQNPIYAAETLKNYHFFYDLLAAGTIYVSHIPASDLIFRFYPVFFSLLLGTGSYYLLLRLFQSKASLPLRDKTAAFFSLYLIYFAGSFGWIVEYLREKHFGGESAFWANQAVSFNLNPPFAASMVIMTAVLYLIAQNLKGLRSKILIVLMAGVLASFKSYTGVLVIGALFVVGIAKIIKVRDYSYLLTAVFAVIITGILFLSNFEPSTSLMLFAPFWFVHSMVDSPDRVGWYRLSLARTASYTLEQWPKFILTEAISLGLFIFGNLGLRFFAFASLLKFKEIFKSGIFLFLFSLTSFSILIPVFFIQSGNPWNTIQFFYPTLYTTALISGPVIAFLILKLNKITGAVLTAAFLILAPVNSIVSAGMYLGKTPHAYVPVQEAEALEFLKRQPDGTVLSFPYDEKLKNKISEPRPIVAYDSTAYISAFSAKAVYLEDLPQNQILLTESKKRLAASKDFFNKSVSQSREFLKSNNIKYIYLPLVYRVRLDESTKILKNIFENKEAVIYEVINDN